MVNLSQSTAIAQFPRGRSLQGRPASALWHSTYSLYLSISWRNKVGIPMTWLMNKLFGRGLSRM